VKEKQQQPKSSLFSESVKNHQRLVNVLVEAQNKSGISLLSQQEASMLMNHSPVWVRKAIKRLNIENTCITMIAPGKYGVHYTDILGQGVFFEILKLIMDCKDKPELLHMEDRMIATQRGINIKTVQMFKTYVRSDLAQELATQI
jgi:hypothetical protein